MPLPPPMLPLPPAAYPPPPIRLRAAGRKTRAWAAASTTRAIQILKKERTANEQPSRSRLGLGAPTSAPVGLPTPHYAIVESLGPDHRRVFRVELRVNGQCFATGEGATIKSAHQAAARAALDIFETEIEKLKETHSPNGDSANEPPSAESPPARIPITDTIF